MEGAKLKALKEVFPELRNFEGRFFGLFLLKLSREVEDWSIWARLELGKKKCYDLSTNMCICRSCKNLNEYDSCEKHPNLGQNFDGPYPNTKHFATNTLKHPNTEEWYWCIKECPDYAEIGE